MNILELRKKEIQSFSKKIDVPNIEFTKEEYKTLGQLEELGFVNTQQYLKLEQKRKDAYYANKNKKINKDIEFLENNGFKVLSNEFVQDFKKKYNLDQGSANQYVLDIPLPNLENINKKVDLFFKIIPELTEIINKYKYKDKSKVCLEFLEILAPVEHFDKNIPLNDPDPVAILKLYNVDRISEKIHYLYLDAWDIEKFMFDNDTNNPELLN